MLQTHSPIRPRRTRLSVFLPRFCGLRSLSVGLILAGGLPLAAHAAGTATSAPAAPADVELEQVLVVSKRANRVSSGATNLDMDIKETPQSISVVTEEQMAQFDADSLNEALRLVTGIQVEEWETNRTNYLARGFEIANTQIDGVGLPNGWGIVTGAIDSFGYEKLEVIRGANGLLTGVGNASGTINYVRKRPTNAAQGRVSASYGSWGTTRFEADYSTPFTASGSWAGRAVAAREDGESYLRGYEEERSFLYGVIDGQVGRNGTLAFGYSWQEARSTENMWGALTFVNDDGSQAEWDRSASTTQDWTYWDTTTEAGFAEYTHRLGLAWELKASYNYRRITNDDQLFFAYTLTGLDPETGEGLLGWAYKGQDESTAHLGDVRLNGAFELLGREHEAVLGVSLARSEGTDWMFPTDFGGPAFGALPAFPYAGDVIDEPEWGDRTVSGWTNQRLLRAFGATRVSLTERLKAVVGFNYAKYHRDGNNGVDFDQTEDNISPYAGLTYDVTETLLAYVSYSDIYQPQDRYDVNRVYLDPTKGVNYEAGVKAEWLDRRLMTTFAWFHAEQEGLATYGGVNENAQYWYYGVDVESEGFELEATGQLNRYTQLVFGVTSLEMSGLDGDDTYPWVPRRTANLMLSVDVPGYTALSLGLGGRWQSDTFAYESYTGLAVRQDSYAVLNAFAAWQLLPNATVRANVRNLTDEKYINSLYNIGYYGAPRNYTLTLDWRF